MSIPKSENTADISSDFLTIDGVAKYLSVSRSIVSKLMKNPEDDFPKSFEILKTDKRIRHLFKKEEIAQWVESKRSKG
tara:strand:+ start:102 stop:335 length:234 start_codon:yes stop_codon:yes gene_type:complete